MESLLTSASSRARCAQALLVWFERSMRPLPWRQHYTPYAVWISEIMLQQTQMQRGVQYFTRWMEQFPTIAAVADAPENAILKAWEGLGYYSRARNLHAAAKRIMEEHGGAFPQDPADILALPGIGEYSAGAIASIAFNIPAPAVDANAVRVISRLYDIDTPPAQSGVREFIREAIRSLMPQDQARSFTQALMELGALVCSKNPRCAECPIAAWCEAKRLGTTAERPVPAKKTVYTTLDMATGILCRQGKVLIQKRLPFGVWAGLWEFPGGCLEEGESPEQALVREFWEETEIPVRIDASIATVRHAFTTCRVTLHAFACSPTDAVGVPTPVLHAASEALWVTPGELEAYTFPAGHRKLIELVNTQGLWNGISLL